MHTPSSNPIDNDRRLRTVSELCAAYDGLRDSDFWRWCSERRFKGAFVTDQGIWLIPEAEVEHFLHRVAKNVENSLQPFEAEVAS